MTHCVSILCLYCNWWSPEFRKLDSSPEFQGSGGIIYTNDCITAIASIQSSYACILWGTMMVLSSIQCKYSVCYPVYLVYYRVYFQVYNPVYREAASRRWMKNDTQAFRLIDCKTEAALGAISRNKIEKLFGGDFRVFKFVNNWRRIVFEWWELQARPFITRTCSTEVPNPTKWRPDCRYLLAEDFARQLEWRVR